jgi:hypothetical protein
MSRTLSHPVSGSSPLPEPASDLERKFLALADTWTRETAHLSSTQQMADHPAYREVVSLGLPVVPLIFKELVREPGFHWFHALREIIGSGPEIPAEARGRLRPVMECWLRWGKEHGISW